MRVIIQRVKSFSVSIEDRVVAKIGRGLNLLVGISATDTETELDWVTSLRPTRTEYKPCRFTTAFYFSGLSIIGEWLERRKFCSDHHWFG